MDNKTGELVKVSKYFKLLFDMLCLQLLKELSSNLKIQNNQGKTDFLHNPFGDCARNQFSMNYFKVKSFIS